MEITRRSLIAAAGTAAVSVAAPAFAAWEESSRYPDPRVQILDPSFGRYRIAQASVERLHTGARWNEGPVWMGDWRCVLWTDIPNNRILRWDEATGRTSTYRQPSNNSNGLTRDRPVWRTAVCAENNTRVKIEDEDYFLSADGKLMPTRKDQPPPDTRYFTQTKR